MRLFVFAIGNQKKKFRKILNPDLEFQYFFIWPQNSALSCVLWIIFVIMEKSVNESHYRLSNTSDVILYFEVVK